MIIQIIRIVAAQIWIRIIFWRSEVAELGPTNEQILSGIQITDKYLENRLIGIRLTGIQLTGIRMIICYLTFK